MDASTALEKVLQSSVDRFGNQPLTTEHLLNIVKMANRSIIESGKELNDRMDQKLNNLQR